MTGGALDRLARYCGIEPEYWQIDGTHHVCGPESQKELLAAMGLDVSNDADAVELLEELKSAKNALPFPAPLIIEAQKESDLPLPPWRIVTEAGDVVVPDAAAPSRIPPLPPGVHELSVEDHRALVIAAPARAPSVEDITGRPMAWGVWTSLYGLRSARNAGVGDYEDLAQLAKGLARKGANFVAINPVHALGIAETGVSPYSPSSRTTLDTGHIALDRIPELTDAPHVQELMAKAEIRFVPARAAPLVDRVPRHEVSERALRALFEVFDSVGTDARQSAFRRWCTCRDPDTALQSVYEALSIEHGPDWRSWPLELQKPGGTKIRAFTHEKAREIRYHDWRQWLAETQLEDAQQRARAAGMSLGLYLDIAVGVRPGAAETWARRDVFATGVSLGAPPDLLNAQGQRWNLSSFSPMGLAAHDFGPFRQMLRNTMKRAGIARIDHVIGLRRAFWVPDNGAPGGYVNFPTDILLALVRIEACRAGCIVVGEDLGTVPEGLRESLAESNLLGCSILPFERQGEDFLSPTLYRPQSLASFGTHDLPSLAGWWAGRDIETRSKLGHIGGNELQAAYDERKRERRSLCRTLATENLLPAGIDPENPPETFSADLRDAVHTLLGQSSAHLVALGLDDILLSPEQQNIPGTVDEMPNWRRPAPVTLEALADSPDMERTAAIMVAAGRSSASEIVRET